MGKYLITGVSGTGKTYLTAYGVSHGLPSVDADTIDGLSSWFSNRKKVRPPHVITEKFLDTHAFLWDKHFLSMYLSRHEDIYIFGVAGNIFDCIELFDKSFYLHLPTESLKDRLESPTRFNQMGKTAEQQKAIIAYEKVLTHEARVHGLTFLQANQEPKAIYDEIGHLL